MQKVNHIALLIDRSDSTRGITPEIIRQVNSQLDLINQKSAAENQRSHVSVYTFSDVADRPILFDVPTDLVQIKPLTDKSYTVSGMTAMLDSVGMAINDLSQFHKDIHTSDDHSFLIMVFTDGQENNSHIYKSSIKALMESKVKTDLWTFVFSVPRGYRSYLVNTFGIPEGNVQEWDTSAGSAGVKQAAVFTSSGLNNYFTARSSGLRSTSKFYTDLSSVTKQDLSQLNNVTSGFKKKMVEKEMDIKTFCTYNFGEYVIGNAFYMLTKPEKVQDHKKLAIEDKATGRIYGDDRVRDMLGLPAVGEVKVTPGNHMNYNIYVQSTSVNRKLVRGSYLLYHKAAQGASI